MGARRHRQEMALALSPEKAKIGKLDMPYQNKLSIDRVDGSGGQGPRPPISISENHIKEKGQTIFVCCSHLTGF